MRCFLMLALPLLLAAEPYNPTVKPASGEGQAAITRFQLDKSLKVELWAAEPMLANPVAFAFDEKGRCYVVETFRHTTGVTDNRGKPWLDDELASRTVEDRVKMYKAYAKDKFESIYEKERDRIRLLEDTTGSGKADKSTVFRDDFGKAEDGLAAGVLARHGSVYFTNVPSLYLLKDTKNTGTADVKEVLATGFGVHVAFIGHDLHGLRIGPDGRLYFTMGDRGLNVKTKEGKHLYYPDCGAVLRCDLDGSNLEVVHSGLRNPQELAFDDHGNLFTVDNNSDSGDRARFVYVVEGGDSGWRIGYQYGSSMHDATVKQGNRGPWNYEKLWHPAHVEQAAYITPTFTNFADGPSGLTHYPGIGLADKYKDHLFLCDFRGGANGSGVFSFAAKPKGAGFEVSNPQKFVWSVLATDCDFGPDSNLYISDWTEGWNKPGKGRIYKVIDAEAQKNAAVSEARDLLAKPFSDRPIGSLVDLLSHPHQQVRTEAQFALVKLGKIEPLADVATTGKNSLGRLHAIWGISMLGDVANGEKVLIPLLKDSDNEVRAQAAKALGQRRTVDANKALLAALTDPEPRVVFMALQSLAKERGYLPSIADDEKYVATIVKVIETNANKDPYIRFAASRALARSLHDALPNHPAYSAIPAVQLAAVVAMRQKINPTADYWPGTTGTAGEALLRSTDPAVLSEIARLIHDVNIPADLPKLAALSANSKLPPAVLYRALNAHYRLGLPQNAKALAAFAASPEALPTLRVLALQMLGNWGKPPRRDFITGMTQSIAPRDTSIAADGLKQYLGGIFAGPAAVQKEAAGTAGKLGITEVGPFLFSLVNDAKALPTTRVEALNGLAALKDAKLNEAVTKSIAGDDPRLRNAGRAILLRTKPDDVVSQLKAVLAGDNLFEKQGAIALLAQIKSPEGDALLSGLLDKAVANSAPAELHLDILDAVGSREPLKSSLKKYDDARPKGDDLAPWRETLVGGDAARGRDIFINKAAVSCQRCHRLDGEGGDVGPAINGIAGKQKRDYLLEAIALPNKQIAKGFESVLITNLDGKSFNGVLKFEDAKEVRLITPEGQLITVKKEEIDERRATKTAMPEDVVQKLTKQELRDLVEFLATLKEEWKK